MTPVMIQGARAPAKKHPRVEALAKEAPLSEYSMLDIEYVFALTTGAHATPADFVRHQRRLALEAMNED